MTTQSLALGCKNCGGEITQPATGKRRKFCTRRCQDAWHNALKRRQPPEWETQLGKLLDELFPHGLTDDCPARRSA